MAVLIKNEDRPVGRNPAAASQRRTLRVLVGAQVFAAPGGSAVAAGALLAFDLTGSTALASLPPAVILIARCAAAGLSLPEQRGRAMSRVVFVTTVGAVAGPNLLAPAGSAAHAVGLPPLTGLYVFAAVMYACAAGRPLRLLRPDPLRVAVALRPRVRAGRHADSAPVPLRRLLASAGA